MSRARSVDRCPFRRRSAQLPRRLASHTRTLGHSLASCGVARRPRSRPGVQAPPLAGRGCRGAFSCVLSLAPWFGGLARRRLCALARRRVRLEWCGVVAAHSLGGVLASSLALHRSAYSLDASSSSGGRSKEEFAIAVVRVRCGSRSTISCLSQHVCGQPRGGSRPQISVTGDSHQGVWGVSVPSRAIWFKVSHPFVHCVFEWSLVALCAGAAFPLGAASAPAAQGKLATSVGAGVGHQLSGQSWRVRCCSLRATIAPLCCGVRTWCARACRALCH